MATEKPHILLLEFLRAEWAQLVAMQHSTRPWQMPFAAALCIGLPLLAGVYVGHMNYGLAGSLGGLSFLYLPRTPMSHRMVALMACAFAMCACFTLGLVSQFAASAMIVVLMALTMLVMMVVRFYGLGPPGGLIFMMAAAIAASTPVQPAQVPMMVGLMTLGALLSWLIAFFYSLQVLRVRAPQPVPALPTPTFDTVIFEPVVIGLFVGLSLLLAHVLLLPRAYWVPVSCLAVIQAPSLRAVWDRQLHRIIGTCAGLLLAWGLLLLPIDRWGMALTMMGLMFIVETLIVRHYALAVVFITPMAILLAEVATLGQGSVTELIRARLLDTLLGCAVGLFGGWCLYQPRFRDVVGAVMRKLVPKRFVR